MVQQTTTTSSSPMVSTTKITHCIFDVDGLMLDTTPLFHEANRIVLADFDVTFDLSWSRAMAGMCGKDAVVIMLKLAGLQDRCTADEYMRRCDKKLLEILPRARLQPGIERLIRHLYQHKIPLAICTGSRDYTFNLKMQDHQSLLSCFQHTVLAGTDPDVKRGKPAPDPFLVCMSRFTQQPASSKSVLVFEDAPNGVQSALAAGMHVVMVPDKQFADDNHSDAHLVISSMENFKPELFGLPAFS